MDDNVPRKHLLAVSSVALGVLLLARGAAPTSVVAPTLPDLVSTAESIVVADVVDVRSAWVVSRAGRAIVTDVTFSIRQTLKGTTYAQRSFEFLGGTVGDDTLRVSGMPEFHIGDRDVLFLRDSGTPVSPIVGLMYGRFRIVRDATTGVEIVRTYDGRPLAALEEIGRQQPPAFVAPARALTLNDFLSAVNTRVRAPR